MLFFSRNQEYSNVCDVFENVPEETILKTAIFFNIIIIDMYKNIARFLKPDSENDILDFDLTDFNKWDDLRDEKSFLQYLFSPAKRVNEFRTLRDDESISEKIEYIYKKGCFSEEEIRSINKDLIGDLLENKLKQADLNEAYKDIERYYKGYLYLHIDKFLYYLGYDQLLIPKIPLENGIDKYPMNPEDRVIHLLYILTSVVSKSGHCQDSYSDITTVIMYLLARSQELDKDTFQAIHSLLYYATLAIHQNNLVIVRHPYRRYNKLIDPYKIRLILDYVIDLIKPEELVERRVERILQDRFYDLFCPYKRFSDNQKIAIKSVRMLFHLSPYGIPQCSLEYKYVPVSLLTHLRNDVYIATKWLHKTFILNK